MKMPDATTPLIVQTPAQTRDQIRTDVQNQVRNEVRDAIRAAKEASQEAVQQAQKAATDADQAARAAAQGGNLPDMPPPAGFPGMAPQFPHEVIPPQVPQMLSIMGVTLVCCVIGFPIARALARWIDRRGTTAPVSREVTQRLEAIEQAVESIAVEVERISEGQRFTTRLLSERTHEPVPTFGAHEREVVPLVASPNNARRG